MTVDVDAIPDAAIMVAVVTVGVTTDGELPCLETAETAAPASSGSSA